MKTPAARLLLVPTLLLAANCGYAQEGGLAACESAANSGIANVAVEACSRVIESEVPAAERARAYTFRAGALQFLGKRAEAIADLDASVRLAPGDAAVLANRGAIYNIQGQLDLAVRDLDAALQLDPNNALALGNRGIVHEKRGEWVQARALVDRALAIEPETASLWGERCWIDAVTGSDPAVALSDCDRAVELAAIPNNFNSRALARYRAGKFAEAIADYDRAIEGAPDVASSYYMRGMAKRAAGLPGAQQDIDKGLALEPGVPERYAGYGVPAK